MAQQSEANQGNVMRMAADDAERLIRLRRGSLSTGALLSAGLAQIAPAIATFFVMGSIVAASGLSAPLVILIAGIGFAFHVNSNAEFSRVIPSSGFYVTFLSRAFGRRTGAAGGLVYTVSYIALGAAIFYQIGIWTSTSVLALFGFDLPWWIAALVIEAAVALLIILGVRISIRTAVTLFGFEIAVMLAGAIAMLVAHPGAVSGAAFNPANLKGGATGLGLGFPLAIFLFLGASTPAPMSEETKSPRRTVPIAIFGATAAAVIIYVFMSWVENIGFNININVTALTKASFPFLTAAGNAAGTAMTDVMYVAGFTSAIAVLLAAGNPTTRVWHSMAREGLLPAWMASVHPRFKTPARVVAVFIPLEMALTLALGFAIGADSSFSYTAEAGTIGVVIIFIAVNIALTTYFVKHRPDMLSIGRHVIAPIIGTLAFLYPLWEAVKPTQESPYNWFGVMWLVLLAAAVVFGVVRGPHTRLGSMLADDGRDSLGTTASPEGTANPARHWRFGHIRHRPAH